MAYKTAIKAIFRTSGLEPHSRDMMKTKIPQHKGHREFIAELAESLEFNYIDRPMDSMPHVRMWERGYEVDVNSMDPRNELAGIPTLNVPGIVVFTDGSMDRTKQTTGAGVAFFTEGRPVHVAGKQLVFSYKLKGKNSWPNLRDNISYHIKGCNAIVSLLDLHNHKNLFKIER